MRRCTARVSGGEPLAPTRAPPLEDRAAAAGGHPRSEPVTPLAAANVRLIGAFHVVCPSLRLRGAASIDGPLQRRRFPQSGVLAAGSKSLLMGQSSLSLRATLAAVFHTCGQSCGRREIPAKQAIFSSTDAACATLSLRPDGAMLAPSRRSPRTARTGGAPRRDTSRRPLERHRRPAEGHPHRYHLRHLVRAGAAPLVRAPADSSSRSRTTSRATGSRAISSIS